MSMVDGIGLIEWEGGLFDPSGDLLPRVRWAFAQIRAAGGSISLNEAGRPYGVPSDANVRSASQTASGRSTVWYQWGRYERDETPEAANPLQGVYASEHTQGKAIDCNAAQPSLRAQYFAMVGLVNTIRSEPWHWAIRGGSSVDLSDYANAAVIETPEQREERELMSAKDDIINGLIPIIIEAARVQAKDALRAKLYRLKDGPNAGRIFARNLTTGAEWDYLNPNTLWDDIAADKTLGLVGDKESEPANLTQGGYARLLQATPKS